MGSEEWGSEEGERRRWSRWPGGGGGSRTRERASEKERERRRGGLKFKKMKEEVQSFRFFPSLSLSTKCEAFSRHPREYDAAFPSKDRLAQRELSFLPLRRKRAANAAYTPKASAATKMRLMLFVLERPSSRRRPQLRRPPPWPCSGSRGRTPTRSCAGCCLEGSLCRNPAPRRS